MQQNSLSKQIWYTYFLNNPYGLQQCVNIVGVHRAKWFQDNLYVIITFNARAYRRLNPITSLRPVCSYNSTIWSASFNVVAIGFTIDIYACFQENGYLFSIACLWGKYKGTIQIKLYKLFQRLYYLLSATQTLRLFALSR